MGSANQDVSTYDSMEWEDSAPSYRTLKHIHALAEVAGLKTNNSITQEIMYSPIIASSNFKLLEVPNELMTVLNQSQSVELRGEEEDEAVLCTDSDTFEMRTAFTSNCLLLAEDLALPKTDDYKKVGTLKRVKVLGSLGSYFELKRIRPRLTKLKMLLQEAPYSGPTSEMDIATENKYTYNDLQERVQASDAELIRALKDFEALLIEGHWRVLESDYKDRVFAQVLKLLEEKDWNYQRVPLDESCFILEELYPRFVTEHCLRLHAKEVTVEEESGQSIVKLCEDKVCRFFAECILRGAGNFHYHEFLQVWKESVPDGMTPSEAHLKGLALHNQESHPPSIFHFPVSSLAEDAVSRFRQLFEVREKWFQEDIEPYLSDLVSQGQTLNSMFLKYARCSTDATGRKVFNARRPVI